MKELGFYQIEGMNSWSAKTPRIGSNGDFYLLLWNDVTVYDYLDMDWYTRAEETRRPVIHGPWVDYTGSDAG